MPGENSRINFATRMAIQDTVDEGLTPVITNIAKLADTACEISHENIRLNKIVTNQLRYQQSEILEVKKQNAILLETVEKQSAMLQKLLEKFPDPSPKNVDIPEKSADLASRVKPKIQPVPPVSDPKFSRQNWKEEVPFPALGDKPRYAGYLLHVSHIPQNYTKSGLKSFIKKHSGINPSNAANHKNGEGILCFDTREEMELVIRRCDLLKLDGSNQRLSLRPQIDGQARPDIRRNNCNPHKPICLQKSTRK